MRGALLGRREGKAAEVAALARERGSMCKCLPWQGKGEACGKACGTACFERVVTAEWMRRGWKGGYGSRG